MPPMPWTTQETGSDGRDGRASRIRLCSTAKTVSPEKYLVCRLITVFADGLDVFLAEGPTTCLWKASVVRSSKSALYLANLASTSRSFLGLLEDHRFSTMLTRNGVRRLGTIIEGLPTYGTFQCVSNNQSTELPVAVVEISKHQLEAPLLGEYTDIFLEEGERLVKLLQLIECVINVSRKAAYTLKMSN